MKKLLLCILFGLMLSLLVSCRNSKIENESPDINNEDRSTKYEQEEIEGTPSNFGDTEDVESRDGTAVKIPVVPIKEGTTLKLTYPVYTENTYQVYSTELSRKPGELYDSYHELNAYSDAEEMSEEYQEYTGPIISLIDSDGLFTEIESIEGSASSSTLLAMDKNHINIYSLYCHHTSYQVVAYTTIADKQLQGGTLFIDYDAIADHIQYYTGLDLTAPDIEMVHDMVLQVANQDGSGSIVIEDQNTQDRFGISVVYLGQDNENWQFDTSVTLATGPD